MYWEIAETSDTQSSIDTSTSSNLETGFRAALLTIILADLSMSLDNVLAVAGAAKVNLLLLVIG